MERIGAGLSPLACVFALVAGVGAAQAQSVEVEFAGGGALNLPGSRAIVEVFNGRTTQTADSGERTTLPSIGFGVTRWGGGLGVFADVSYIDGGTATASIGPFSSEVTSHVFDFHGGTQWQFPSGRLRPYVGAGGGFARISTSGTLDLGSPERFDSSEWLSSLVYGGGVRFDVSESLGFRTGIEGVTVTPVTSDSVRPGRTYARFVVSVFWSGRPAPGAPVSPPPPIAIASPPAMEPSAAGRAIAAIRTGEHGTLPPARITGSNRTGGTTLAVRNATTFALRFLLAGPQEADVTIAPGQTATMTVAPGDYEVAASVSSPTVTPFYGMQQFFGGNDYTQMFYIAVR